MVKRTRLALLTIATLSLVAPLLAQTPVSAQTQDGSDSAAAVSTSWRFFARRFDVSNAEIGMRLKTESTDGQQVATRDAQYRISTRIRFALAPEGGTYLQSEVETGSGFLSTWTNSGIGQKPTAWIYSPKTFYLGQKIASLGEVQVGGLRYDQGAGTDAIYANSGGWVSGYRMVLGSSKSHSLLPNRFAVTVGYVGDYAQPNFFLRAYRMAEPNYVQVLGQKKISRHEASLELDALQGVYFTRGAFHAREISKADNLTIEYIQRSNLNPAFGWSTTIDKNLGQAHHWRTGVTYSDLPRKMFDKAGTQILLNSAGLTCGKVFGPVVHYTPVKTVDLFAYTSRRVDGEVLGSTRWRMQVGVRYQVTQAVNSFLNRLR